MVLLDEKVLCNSVFPILGDDAWIFLQQFKLLLLTSSVLLVFFFPPHSDDEEMLISEEEVPFKDDPRDETYRPHLEKYVGLDTYCAFSHTQ